MRPRHHREECLSIWGSSKNCRDVNAQSFFSRAAGSPRVQTWAAVDVALALPRAWEAAPPDYRWVEHCDPIRRGVPANIPTLPEGWTLEYRGRPKAK